MDCSLSGSSVRGLFQAEDWSGVPLPSPCRRWVSISYTQVAVHYPGSQRCSQLFLELHTHCWVPLPSLSDPDWFCPPSSCPSFPLKGGGLALPAPAQYWGCVCPGEVSSHRGEACVLRVLQWCRGVLWCKRFVVGRPHPWASWGQRQFLLRECTWPRSSVSRGSLMLQTWAC